MNPPTLNPLKAGGSIALKFSLTGNQGLNIFAAGFRASRQINCSARAPMGSYAAANPPGSNGLAYQPKPNQYIYTWRTNKAWASTCRQFDLKLIDSTEHFSNFQFK